MKILFFATCVTRYFVFVLRPRFAQLSVSAENLYSCVASCVESDFDHEKIHNLLHPHLEKEEERSARKHPIWRFPLANFTNSKFRRRQGELAKSKVPTTPHYYPRHPVPTPHCIPSPRRPHAIPSPLLPTPLPKHVSLHGAGSMSGAILRRAIVPRPITSNLPKLKCSVT